MNISPPSTDARAAPVAVAFRDLMSGFPTGVAVVTAMDSAGQPHGLTCTSLTSVAVDPPTLLVCLDVRSGTLAAVRDQGAFAVNLLHTGGRSTADLFASPVPDRFRRVAWQPSAVVGAPWLVDDGFALAECRVTRLVPAADHTVVLAEVVGSAHTCAVPLLYGLRQFAAWPAGGGNGSPA